MKLNPRGFPLPLSSELLPIKAVAVKGRVRDTEVADLGIQLETPDVNKHRRPSAIHYQSALTKH